MFIHFLFCRKCLFQYVGKTANEFHFKWKNYKNNYRNYDCNQSCMERHLNKYYSSFGHCGFLEHVSIIFIGKTQLSDS